LGFSVEIGLVLNVRTLGLCKSGWRGGAPAGLAELNFGAGLERKSGKLSCAVHEEWRDYVERIAGLQLQDAFQLGTEPLLVDCPHIANPLRPFGLNAFEQGRHFPTVRPWAPRRPGRPRTRWLGQLATSCPSCSTVVTCRLKLQRGGLMMLPVGGSYDDRNKSFSERSLGC
jgi:hypothetical protein